MFAAAAAAFGGNLHADAAPPSTCDFCASVHRRVVHRRHRSLLARIHGRRDAGTLWRRMGERREQKFFDFGSLLCRLDKSKNFTASDRP